MDVQSDQQETEKDGNDRRRAQEFPHHLHGEAAGFARPAYQRDADELREAAADKIEEHDIRRRHVAEQLQAHGETDENGVAHGSHHHKNAELAVRQPHQAARQQAQHNAAWNDEQRNKQQARRGEHVRAREIVLHPVDQHDGNTDGHQIAADEGLDLRGHPALDCAEIAGRRQQQDNGDGCNGVKKGFHRSVPQKILFTQTV